MAEAWEIGRLLRGAGELARHPASEANDLRKGRAFWLLRERIAAEDWAQFAEEHLVPGLASGLPDVERRIETYLEYQRAPWAARETPAQPTEPPSSRQQLVENDGDPSWLWDWPPRCWPVDGSANEGPSGTAYGAEEAWCIWAARTFTFPR